MIKVQDYLFSLAGINYMQLNYELPEKICWVVETSQSRLSGEFSHDLGKTEITDFNEFLLRDIRTNVNDVIDLDVNQEYVDKMIEAFRKEAK